MTRHTILAVGVLALAACGQPQQQAETTQPIEAPAVAQISDADFVQQVANSDAFEVQSSQLAGTRAALQPVKDFAAMMVRDHTATTQQLTALAPTLNMTAPTPSLDADHTAKLASLRSARGPAFDDAYVDAQVQGHRAAVHLFETYLQGAPAGGLRDWAQNTLPKLREHLAAAEALDSAS